MSTNHEQWNSTFPEPIGGVPVRGDFAPSLIFCIGFLTVGIIGVFDMFSTRRTLLKVSSFSVALERSLVMAMRMVASFRQDVRESVGMTEYQQITLGIGFLTMFDEQIYLIASALTLATREGMTWNEWWQLAQKDPTFKAHRGKEREKYRKWATRCHWAFLTAQSLQITSGSFHWTQNQTVAQWVIVVRFIGNCMSLFLIASILSTVHRFKDIEPINKLSLLRPKITLICLLVIPLYRACVSFRRAETLATSPTPAIPAKVAFYVFQLLPELTACAITTLTNYREISDTGPHGDYSRKRVEMGLPPAPIWLVLLGYIFAPWRWPGALARLILRSRERGEEKENGRRRNESLFADDDREKLLTDMPSVGWRSVPDLSSTRARSFYSEKMDMNEKGSTNMVTDYTRSGGWSRFGGSTSPGRENVEDINTSNPLITDVNLWRPRLPAAFSFRRE